MIGDQDKVLLVQPDVGLRCSVANALKSAGLCVIEAASGAEALVLAEKLLPSAALIDTNIPDVPASELTTRLKEVCPNITSLICSPDAAHPDCLTDISLHLDKFHSMKKAVTDAREHWDSASMMVQNVKALADASDCALFSLDVDGLLFVAHTAVDLTVPAGIRLGPGDTYAWKCLDNGKQLFIEDLVNEGMRFDRMTATRGKFASALYLPLVYRGLKLGVLALGFGADKPCRLDETSLKSIDVLAAQAALLLDGMRLLGEAEERANMLEAQSRRMQAIFDAIPGVLMICDSTGKIVQVNGLANNIMTGALGRWTDAFNSDGAFRITRPDGTPYLGVEIPVARSITSGEFVWAEQMLCSLPSGECYAVLANSAPMYSPDGSISGGVTIMQDISELHNAYQDLEHKVHRERMVTERLQTAFLPTELPELHGFELATKYVPAARDEALVGGDFYDLFELPDGKMGIVIADVSGKGISAAVYTAMTKYMLHAYAIEDPGITSVIEKLNSSLCARIPSDYFVTLFYGVIDIPTRSFTYVNAGHEQPILAGSSAGFAIPLDVTGRALGLIPQSNFTSRTITFEPGDILFLYTDGLTDYRTPFGRLGVEGLSQYLDWLIGAPAHQIVDDLWSALNRDDPGGMRDDVALMCLRVLE